MRKAEKLTFRQINKTFKTKGRCPFIGNSFPQCYCMDMNSLRIDDAIYYCGKNFTLCPIYNEKKANKR